MSLSLLPTGQACGAIVRGVDLAVDLDRSTVGEIRQAWLDHRVLVFPDQQLTDEDLERFTLYFGPFGEETFLMPIDGHPHIAAIHRAADETAPIFADSWHADWSFQEHPPDGTCLCTRVIPPAGGDTLFADQIAALASMPADLRSRLEGLRAVHSARAGYAPDGLYGEADSDNERVMRIIISDEANAIQHHPIISPHPETGEDRMYGTFGYIVGIEGMDEAAARDLLFELYQWQIREDFQYRHAWQPDMFVMWDNRSVLHRATGGYDGYERRLHRTTIGYHPSGPN